MKGFSSINFSKCLAKISSKTILFKTILFKNYIIKKIYCFFSNNKKSTRKENQLLTYNLSSPSELLIN